MNVDYFSWHGTVAEVVVNVCEEWTLGDRRERAFILIHGCCTFLGDVINSSATVVNWGQYALLLAGTGVIQFDWRPRSTHDQVVARI